MQQPLYLIYLKTRINHSAWFLVLTLVHSTIRSTLRMTSHASRRPSMVCVM